VIGAAPALLATWHWLRRKDGTHETDGTNAQPISPIRPIRPISPMVLVAIAILAGALIVVAGYAGAALASDSLQGYWDAVEAQRKWVREVDSWRNPIRGSLWGAAVLFFVQPFQHEDLMRALALFVAASVVAGLVRRRTPVLLVLATFAPLAAIAWLNFDVNTASRYAISYLALHALLAADGFLLLGRRRAVQLFLAVATVLVSLGWSWPALRLQRSTPAPPVAAMQWIAQHVPAGDPILVHGSFYPHADVLLAGRNVTVFEDDEVVRNGSGVWVVDWRTYPDARNFTYPRTNTLWKVLRQRAFETSVRHVPERRE
jgi:hypothetical protein